MRTVTLLTFSTIVGFSTACIAQTVTLLGDLNKDPSTVVPHSSNGIDPVMNYAKFATNIPFTYFTAHGPNGIELFLTLPTTTVSTRALVEIDIWPGPGSSNPGGLTMLNNKLFLFADNGATGRELWRIDERPFPQSPLPVLVADINPGLASSSRGDGNGRAFEAGAIAVMGSTLYFLVDAPGVAGLYTTTGTGATLVKALTPKPPGRGTSSLAAPMVVSENERRIVAAGGRVYFAANDGKGAGFELWSSDGTTVGTIVHDINPGAGDSNPGGLFPWNGEVYFRADDGATGSEPWKCGASPVQLADLDSGAAGSEPGVFTELSATQLLFSASTMAQGRELYTSDGTTASLLFDHYPAATRDGNPGKHGFVRIGNELFYSAQTRRNDHQLWKTDGTLGGTVQLTTRTVLNGRFGSGDGVQGGLLALGGDVYFFGADTTVGTEMRRYDPASGSLTLVADIQTSVGVPPHEFTIASNALFPTFLFFHFGPKGGEPYVSDGTAAGTALLADIRPPVPGATATSFPDRVVSHGAKSYFVGTETGGAHVLFETDGTASGTQRVLGVPPSEPEVFPFGPLRRDSAMIAVGTDLYMAWGLPGGDADLARFTPATSSFVVIDTDGTPAPAWGRAGAAPVIAERNGRIYYNAFDDLVVYDPRAPRVVGVNPKPFGVFAAGQFTEINNIQTLGGKLYLVANGDAAGIELWESDGTPGGTRRLSDINTSGDSMQVRISTSFGTISQHESTPLALVGTEVLFFANDGVKFGRELYSYDRNTTLVTAVLDGSGNRLNSLNLTDNRFGSSDGVAYFMADNGITGVELWKYDGTGTATLVRDINPNGHGYPLDPDFFTMAVPSPVLVHNAGKNLMLFAADDGATGLELWATDGTTANTVQLADLNLGPAGSDIRELRAIGTNQAYFVATTSQHGSELWTTDGTPGGTVRVTDIRPSGGNSIASFGAEISYVPGGVLFIADDGVNGGELYHLSTGAVSFAMGTSYSPGQLENLPGLPSIGGCVASGVAPVLRVSDPELGGTLDLEVTGADPSASVAALFFGGQTDPINLFSPLFTNAALCGFYVAPIIVTLNSTANVAGTFSYPSVPISNSPVLIGLRLAAQVAIPQANGLPVFGGGNLALTNGVYLNPGF